MLFRTTVGIAAAGAGLFLGYCIYFDRKRRSDPLFKQKLREKRRNTKESTRKSSSGSKIPVLASPEDMQQFFMQEVQLGEELLAAGDTEGGVEHLSNAIAVCGEPQRLLQALQQTLPPQIFQLIFQKLVSMQKGSSPFEMPTPSETHSSPFGMPIPSKTDSDTLTIVEDDVE